MASFDFARDMMDNLETQGMGYVLITVHMDHSKKNSEYVVTSFEKLNDEEKFAAICGLQKQILLLEQEIKKK